MKRSTSSFYQFLSYWHATNANMFMFNAQSCDMRRYALYRVPVLVTTELILKGQISETPLFEFHESVLVSEARLVQGVALHWELLRHQPVGVPLCVCRCAEVATSLFQ